MLKLNKLSPPRGSKKRKKRVGRGPGSGHGSSATRGQKGQMSRSGGGNHLWFEGGQMPLQRRMPKRGFKPPARHEMQIVNLEALARCGNQETIMPLLMKSVGLIRHSEEPVKILGKGEIKIKVTIQAHAFSKSALEKIQNAGGRAEILK
ncbi:MAG: 50S ribosomal protein L15 [candidate division Zixibacteria bacterium]|nr:50S ribosomal protein L15 [candidate division Zixibacteria bacterium]